MQQRRDQQVRRTTEGNAPAPRRARSTAWSMMSLSSGSSEAALYRGGATISELAVEGGAADGAGPSPPVMLDTTQTKAVIEQLFAWLSEPEVAAVAPLLVGAAPGKPARRPGAGESRTSLIAIGAAHQRMWPAWYIDPAADTCSTAPSLCRGRARRTMWIAWRDAGSRSGGGSTDVSGDVRVETFDPPMTDLVATFRALHESGCSSYPTRGMPAPRCAAADAVSRARTTSAGLAFSLLA
jgi:hypothetical protein